ncbi:hypothetical protein B0T17DRAFT_507936 [Bombardia bombarda]|uniref:Uncharacterized protein n=1 Tax=Bombardia bombarda TaxID=252184 RepID=A0AA39X091_9PEZI|nr:hypothetical protein B0T17DRAFT_507936 [Bombardia bombarda]
MGTRQRRSGWVEVALEKSKLGAERGSWDGMGCGMEMRWTKDRAGIGATLFTLQAEVTRSIDKPQASTFEECERRCARAQEKESEGNLKSNQQNGHARFCLMGDLQLLVQISLTAAEHGAQRGQALATPWVQQPGTTENEVPSGWRPSQKQKKQQTDNSERRWPSTPPSSLRRADRCDHAAADRDDRQGR